jgi:DNA-binding NtrC family response regulator
VVIFSKPCCLVAEDQALIALALEASLEDGGIGIAGPFGSCVEALSWVEQATPALAILDYKLQDGPCTDLAKTLLGRGVPVIIYSGFPHDPETPPELLDVTWLEKPVDPASLLEVVERFAPSLAGHTPRRRIDTMASFRITFAKELLDLHFPIASVEVRHARDADRALRAAELRFSRRYGVDWRTRADVREIEAV